MPTTRDMSDKHEAHVAEVLQGRVTRGSGATFRDQGDGKQPYSSEEFVFGWDCKSTGRGRSITFHEADWDKITQQAAWAQPAIPLRIYYDGMLKRFRDWIVLDLDTAAVMQQTANEAVRLRERVAELEAEVARLKEAA